MSGIAPQAGKLMAAEAAQCIDVYCRAADQPVTGLDGFAPSGIYTIARGSSDAAANILSYEFMRHLGIPVTSLPPSVFSLGAGLQVANAAGLVISQSGASDDLVHATNGLRKGGAKVIAVTNQPGSAVEIAADLTLAIRAGPEHAVPATKSVVGSVAAGVALLSALAPDYATLAAAASRTVASAARTYPQAHNLRAAFLRARHIYVIGRDTGYGAAHEITLKLKECCALHAEAYSASEVLHGPLQLASNPMMVLILDPGAPHIQASLDQAHVRFETEGCDVHRLRVHDAVDGPLTPAAAAALTLALLYPIILDTALALGLDPDSPSTLAKVTKTT